MRGYRIGSAFGIPIKLDITFLVVLPLFAYVIGSQVRQWVGILNDVLSAGIEAGPLTGTAVVAFGLGTLAAVGLFVGVVLHELGHSLVARRYDVEISAITLWLFGGVAQLERMPEDWRQELYVALAGPVVSVLLGVGSFLVFLSVPADGSTVLAAARFLLGYLAVMNIALAAFNLLPGFPMDGGRVLRALLASDQPYAKATQQAATVGKVFAVLLALFALFGGTGINLYLVALAFFIYMGAASEAQQTTMRAAFEGVVVRDIMTPAGELKTVQPATSLSALVDRMFRERHTAYPVVRDGRVVGMVTLGDAQSIREVERDAFTVADVMQSDLETIAPNADAMTAIERIQSSGIGRLLVMDGDELVGLISQTDLMTTLDIMKSTGSLRQGQERESSPTPGKRFSG